MDNKVVKYSTYLTFLALALLLAPLIFDLSAPNLWFFITVGLGLLFLYSSLVLFFYVWLKGRGLLITLRKYLLLVAGICLLCWLFYHLL